MQFDGGDRFEIKENTAFLNKIHKTTEADLEVCFYMAFYLADRITTGSGISSGTTRHRPMGARRIHFAYDPADQRFEFRQYHAAGTARHEHRPTGITFPAKRDGKVAISVLRP